MKNEENFLDGTRKVTRIAGILYGKPSLQDYFNPQKYFCLFLFYNFLSQYFENVIFVWCPFHESLFLFHFLGNLQCFYFLSRTSGTLYPAPPQPLLAHNRTPAAYRKPSNSCARSVGQILTPTQSRPTGTVAAISKLDTYATNSSSIVNLTCMQAIHQVL